MNDELKKIAQDYIRQAEETFLLILQLLNVKDKLELGLLVRKRGDIYFNIKGKRYIIMPHGRGCFFSDGNDEIDWEFGNECVCGIDSMMLSKYINYYYLRFHEKFDVTEIRDEFEKAIQDGEAIERYGLYYFI